ncbi:hypothetical protein [Robiginitalea sp. SC105]|uniref:hypothetical protein n=1 Tax=Robiginitalea sp. SC105 TaxID=2762332 RepID=UPI001639CFD9|nr:hypothetical protein [Robiginitalea sp. SC105]MBC2839429.1 hypothetical protein [Robiginitalea sp. SC105]
MKSNKHNGGFRVPENYFEGFADRIKDRLQASGGAGLPEETGFRVPGGYFENFQDRLTQRLAGEQPGDSRGKVRRLWPARLGWTAAAAAAVILLVTFWPASTADALGFEDLAQTEIQRYLEDDGDDMGAYELAESLPLEEIALSDVLESLPEEDQILDYLNQDSETVDELYWNGDE